MKELIEYLEKNPPKTIQEMREDKIVATRGMLRKLEREGMVKRVHERGTSVKRVDNLRKKKPEPKFEPVKTIESTKWTLAV